MEKLFTRKQTGQAHLLQAGASNESCGAQEKSIQKWYVLTGCLWLFAFLFAYTGEAKNTEKNSVNVAPPYADFSIPDTIWLNSPVTILNNSVGATTAYWDIVGLSGVNRPYCVGTTCYMSNDFNFSTRFPFTGYYDVKLYVTNSGGSATVTKTVYVNAASRVPSADFVIPKGEYTNLETVQLYDMSSGGVTSWKWTLSISPTCQTCWGFDPAQGGSRDTVQNAYFKTDDGGVYTICLQSFNSLGSTKKCKTINVIKATRVCPGGSNPADTFSGNPTGYLVDIGGVADDYIAVNVASCSHPLYIIPCADSIYLEVLQFNINSPTDQLTIYDGPTLSSPSTSYSGTNASGMNRGYGRGGIVVKHTSTRTQSSDTSPGFLIKWRTTKRSFGPATPNFILADTVYSGTSAYLTNTSTGVRYTNKWDTNSDGYYGDENYLAYDSLSTSPLINFINNSPADTTRRYCLKVVNCAGDSVKCKTTVIRPVAGNPIAKFDINTTSGFTEDTFRLVDRSLNGAVQWDWFITPAYARYVAGTNSHSKNPVVMFDYPGYYKIQLQVTNPLNLKGTIIKDSFVNILAYNSPSSKYPLTTNINDVGITNVKVNDLNVTTALQTPAYYFNPANQTTLYRGGRYGVTVSRPTGADAMNRKVWIDLNRNANFTDPGEELISESGTNNLSASDSFSISLTAPIGTLRMRVGASLSSANLTPSSTNYGCYEDYSILIGIDTISPTIGFTVSTDSIIYIEVHKPFHDPGVTAIDNIEGNISSRYQVIGLENLDTSTVGYYTLQYYVDDSYGNRSQYITRLVNVVLNSSGPTLTLNGPSEVHMEVLYGYEEKGYVALDNRGDTITKNVVVTGEVDTTKLGTYTLTYTITDAFNFTTTQQRTVIVSDTTRPVVTIKGGGTEYHQQINTPLEIPVNVTDNYDKAPVVSYTGTIDATLAGTYTLIYTATDSSGNISNPISVPVKVDDFIPPTIILRGSNIMDIDVNKYASFDDVDPGDTAYDNISSVAVSITDNIPTPPNTLGNFYRTYTATDGSGNTASVTRQVNIIDQIAPLISPKGGPLPIIHTRYKPYVEDTAVTIIDNYYQDSTLKRLLIIANNIVVDAPGKYYVTYDVTDPSQNRATTYIREVIVTEEGETGIGEVNYVNGINVFPNPTKGLITISLIDAKGAKTIAVYNNVGALVMQKECVPGTTNYEMNLNEQAAGIYFIRIEGENSVYNQKVNLIK